MFEKPFEYKHKAKRGDPVPYTANHEGNNRRNDKNEKVENQIVNIHFISTGHVSFATDLLDHYNFFPRHIRIFLHGQG